MPQWKRESTRNRARCKDDERLSEMKSREIGEDGIVERKVVAERRSAAFRLFATIAYWPSRPANRYALKIKNAMGLTFITAVL